MKYRLINAFTSMFQTLREDTNDWEFIVETLYLKRKFKIFLRVDINMDASKCIGQIIDVRDYNYKEKLKKENNNG